jgi:chromosomal replication initiator protein
MTDDLSASMLDAMERMGKCAVTPQEIGVNAAALIALARRGLIEVDRDGKPTLYRVTRKGTALIEMLNAPVEPVEYEPPVAHIQRVVAAYFKKPLFEMWSARRSRGVARPRQIAMYFARELTPMSLPCIGRRFGKRDHTTVIHAINTVERLVATDPAFAADVAALREELAG